MEGGGGERAPRGSCAASCDLFQRGQCRTNPVNGALELAGLLSHFSMKSFFKRLFPPQDSEETEERLDRLEVEMRRLQEEWTDVYAKFRVMQMRVAKQAQRLNESSQEEPQGEESDGQVRPGLTLSPRLAKIQEQILERRRRGEPRKEGE